jgi:hypothetical protein
VTKGEGKKFTDPREWVLPKIREDESELDFNTRSREWYEKRARVAKRLGLKLP